MKREILCVLALSWLAFCPSLGMSLLAADEPAADEPAAETPAADAKPAAENAAETPPSDAKAPAVAALPTKGPASGVAKKLSGLDLSEEQLAKIKAIVEEHQPKLAELNRKLQAAMTRDQRRAARQAREAARAEGLKGKQLRARIDEALALSPEQQKTVDAARSQAQAAQAEFAKAVLAVLNPEQVARSGIKAPKSAKKTRKLPAASANAPAPQEDSTEVQPPPAP